ATKTTTISHARDDHRGDPSPNRERRFVTRPTPADPPRTGKGIQGLGRDSRARDQPADSGRISAGEKAIGDVRVAAAAASVPIRAGLRGRTVGIAGNSFSRGVE